MDGCVYRNELFSGFLIVLCACVRRVLVQLLVMCCMRFVTHRKKGVGRGEEGRRWGWGCVYLLIGV